MEGFIDRPAQAHPVPVHFRGLLIQGSKLRHPVEDSGSIHIDMPLGQPLDDIGVS